MVWSVTILLSSLAVQWHQEHHHWQYFQWWWSVSMVWSITTFHVAVEPRAFCWSIGVWKSCNFWGVWGACGFCSFFLWLWEKTNASFFARMDSPHVIFVFACTLVSLSLLMCLDVNCCCSSFSSAFVSGNNPRCHCLVCFWSGCFLFCEGGGKPVRFLLFCEGVHCS